MGLHFNGNNQFDFLIWVVLSKIFFTQSFNLSFCYSTLTFVTVVTERYTNSGIKTCVNQVGYCSLYSVRFETSHLFSGFPFETNRRNPLLLRVDDSQTVSVRLRPTSFLSSPGILICYKRALGVRASPYIKIFVFCLTYLTFTSLSSSRRLSTDQ